MFEFVKMFGEKVRRMDHQQKNDATERARGLGSKKKRGDGNQTTSLASLWGCTMLKTASFETEENSDRGVCIPESFVCQMLLINFNCSWLKSLNTLKLYSHISNTYSYKMTGLLLYNK